MNRSIIFVLLNFLILSIYGKEDKAIFNEANNAFQNGQFSKSIDLYAQLGENDIAYYNMANGYLKLGDTARGILYFEKAIKINPINRNARENLTRIKSSELSYNTDLKENIFLYKELSKILPSYTNVFAYLLVIFFWISLLFLYGFIKTNILVKRRTYLVLSVLFLVIAVLVFNLTYRTHQIDNNFKSAIVTKSTILKEQAHLLSANVLNLPSGIKIYIIATKGEWHKVLFGDGHTAWIENNFIVEI